MSNQEVPTVTGRRVFHGQPPRHFDSIFDALVFAQDQLSQTIEDAAAGRPSDLLLPQMRICRDLVRMCKDAHEDYRMANDYGPAVPERFRS